MSNGKLLDEDARKEAEQHPALTIAIAQLGRQNEVLEARLDELVRLSLGGIRGLQERMERLDALLAEVIAAKNGSPPKSEGQGA